MRKPKRKRESTLAFLAPKMDHRLYEFTRRNGGHTTQIAGQIVVAQKNLTQMEKLVQMAIKGAF